MESLLLILLFPLVWPFIAKHIWHTTINYQEMTLQILIVVVLVVAVWQVGIYNQTVDVTVWNGKITDKDRVHGSYVRSYRCNCYSTCSGSGTTRTCSQTCSTCYEDHYTVDWTAKSTVGNFTFKSLDQLSRSVYNTPDPKNYTQCKINEPAAREHTYTNYIQAAPDSLFNNDTVSKYLDKIPNYPRVHQLYKMHRVINVGSSVPIKVQQELNRQLNNALTSLGSSKQVNIIVIFTNIADPMYKYAVEHAWLGGKINDVVLFVGADNDGIVWVDVMTWALNSGNEFFHVSLRDAIKLVNINDPKEMSSTIVHHILKSYDRPHASDYEYLEDSILPPDWVIILVILLAVIGSLGLTFIFHKYEIDFTMM